MNKIVGREVVLKTYHLPGTFTPCIQGCLYDAKTRDVIVMADLKYIVDAIKERKHVLVKDFYV